MIKRVLTGFGISGVIILLTLVAQVVSVPVLLTKWGNVTYGEWLILTNLALSISVLNFGVQSYVCNLLIACYVQDEIDKGTRILQSALSLYVIFSLIGVGFILLLVTLPGLLVWLKIDLIAANHARVILLIYGVIATYAIVGGLLLSLFQVTKQMPRQLAYGFAEKVIILYSPIVVVWFGGQPVIVALAVAFLLCGLIVVELRDVWKRSPFMIGLSQADRSLALSFVKPGLTFFAVSLAALMVSTGVTVLLANQSGGQAVALFSTTLVLVNLVRTIVNQGMNVLWPEITGVAALKDDPQRLSCWYFLLLKVVSAFVLVCAVGISLVGKDVLTLWTRGRIEVDPLLNLLLAIYLAVQAPILVSSVFGLALNRQADLLKVQVTAGVITLGLGAVLINLYDVRGAAVALLVGQAVIVLWMLKLACTWIDANWSDFLARTLPRLLLGFGMIIFICIALSGASLGIPARLFYAFGLLAGIVIMFWRYWLITAEKNLLCITAASLLKKTYG